MKKQTLLKILDNIEWQRMRVWIDRGIIKVPKNGYHFDFSYNDVCKISLLRELLDSGFSLGLSEAIMKEVSVKDPTKFTGGVKVCVNDTIVLKIDLVDINNNIIKKVRQLGIK